MHKFNRKMWQSFWERNAILFLCFGLPAFIMMAVYFGRGVYPIADHSALVLDLNAQYIYYYEAFRQAILEGKSLLYSWSQSLSGEMIGIFGYYLASPFMIIYLIFPKEAIVEALLVVTLLKCGTLGVSFAIYVRKMWKLDGVKLLILSTLYALSAYAVVQAMNPMWIDGMILLPMIALGLHRLVEKKQFALFVATLALALIINYYIGYMLCILSVFYFLYVYFYKPRKGGFKAFAKTFLRFALAGIVAGGIAAVILLPIYFSLKNGKTDFSKPDFSMSLRFPMLHLFPKLLLDSYDSVNVQGLPMVYSGLLALLLTPTYFLSPSIPMRRKIAAGGLIMVVFAIMNISILDIAMHCFRIPNWLNCRYGFFFSFVLLSLCAESLSHWEDLPRDKLIKTYMGVLGLIVLIQLSAISYIDNFTCIWLSIVFVSVYAIMLGVALNPLKHETMIRAVAFVMVAELTLNTALTLQAIHEEVYYSSHSSYTDFMAESRPVVARIQEMDTSFYRMEKTYHRTVNDPMALGFRGLSHSTSTLNQKALTFLHNLGYSQKEHWSRYLENSVLADSVLGFKYLMAKDGIHNAEYQELFKAGEITVYENPYALPVVFAADADFAGATVNSSNAITFQNQLLNALTGEYTSNCFRPVETVSYEIEDVTEESYGTHKKYTLTGYAGTLTYTIRMPYDGPLYMNLVSDYTNSVSVLVNDTQIGTVLAHETSGVMPLGSFEKGDTVVVKLILSEQETYIRSFANYFYVMDMEKFTAAYEKLKAGGMEIDDHTETYLHGTLSVADDSACIFTSIPYEKGWTVKVDGEPVDVFCGADAVVCFITDKGTHTVEMCFCPPGLVMGAGITAVSLAGFGFWLWLARRKKDGRAIVR